MSKQEEDALREYRADCFARMLLMEERNFRQAWAELPYLEFGTKVAEIAKIFQVPMKQAYIRTKELNLE